MQVVHQLPKSIDPSLLVGTETGDDAGVYQLTDEIALVQTIDFFPPMVNDPFVFGQIAAANSLSDIYAMGATPKTALNLVGFPDDKAPLDWLARILQGGAERCAQAGVVNLGGHSVRDAEIKFGLAVTGLVHPQKVLTNAAAKVGDQLILTKALGTGFMTTAYKAGDCPDTVFQAAIDSMVQLNNLGQQAMSEVGVHAATDVTGFGLAGHALGLAKGSGVTIRLHLQSLPLLAGSLAFAKKAYFTRASASNAAYVANDLHILGKVDPIRLEFFYDAQTSGGLLISVPSAKADQLLANLHGKGISVACRVGEVVAKQASALVVSD